MTLTKRLQGLLIAFNDEQLTYKDKCKRKIQSYLKICMFLFLFFSYFYVHYNTKEIL